MDSLDTFIFYDKIFCESDIEKLLDSSMSASFFRCTDSTDLKKIIKQDGNRNIATDLDFLIYDIDYSLLIKSYFKSLPEIYSNNFIDFKQKKYLVDSKITRYDEGDEYSWHTDFDNNLSAVRYFSSITYLNDDYMGGETEFWGKTIIPQKGKTLIFPSTIMYPHRGKPVIRGKKYILVSHICISHVKNDTEKSSLQYT